MSLLPGEATECSAHALRYGQRVQHSNDAGEVDLPKKTLLLVSFYRDPLNIVIPRRVSVAALLGGRRSGAHLSLDFFVIIFTGKKELEELELSENS